MTQEGYRIYISLYVLCFFNSCSIKNYITVLPIHMYLATFLRILVHLLICAISKHQNGENGITNVTLNTAWLLVPDRLP